MDLILLRQFQRQVLFQCNCLLIAIDDVNREMRHAPRERDLTRIFCGLQNLLNAAANIQKACWGQKARLAAERKPLRDSIGVADDSPFTEVDMRNNYEHFDDRLDKWWRECARHNSFDFALISGFAGSNIDPIEWLRVFDPASGDMFFAGNRLNVTALFNEVMRILPKVREEAKKPHWDDPRAASATANDNIQHAATADDDRTAPHDS